MLSPFPPTSLGTDADFDDSDADGGKSDEVGGLFDSDDSDDEAEVEKKSKKLKKSKKGKGSSKKSKNKDAAPRKKMSKKERMEAMAKRRRIEQNGGVDTSEAVSSLEADGARRKKKGDEGYDSEDSYDSREFVRTKEDDDFIDADDEDPEALQELYREQHFDDERPIGSDSEEEEGRKGNKKGKVKKSRPRGPDALSDFDLNGDQAPDNAILAAVHKMKKKKKEVKKLSELEDEAKTFINRMEQAADADEMAMAERRPATAKLRMLSEVLRVLTKRDMMRPLLEFELLMVARRWVQPLKSGVLGNVTVRQKLLQAIGNMTGENGVNPNDLKRSGFGKTLMALYMHKGETPEMKRMHKAQIEKWSRPIFQRSSNMHDLEKAQKMRRGEGGILGYAQAQAASREVEAKGSAYGGDEKQDLSSIISQGAKGARDGGNNRVRVPYSKGFQFTVRPEHRGGDIRDKKTRTVSVRNQREGLHKRMIDKSRPISKNQRSANISIEGRATK